METRKVFFMAINGLKIPLEGGFLPKWWVSPTTIAFPTKNGSLWGVKWGVAPCKETPINGLIINGVTGVTTLYCTYGEFLILLVPSAGAHHWGPLTTHLYGNFDGFPL